MIAYFCLDREKGENFFNGKYDIIDSENDLEIATVYASKEDAIKSLRSEAEKNIREKGTKNFQFMLFAYYIDDDDYEIVYSANNNPCYPIPATIKEIHKPNFFRTTDLVSIESLYFYLGKENRLRYRRVEHSYIPEKKKRE